MRASRQAKLRRSPNRRRGYSLLEVIVALAVLLVGVVGVLQFFPPSLRASNDAALRSKAAMLAQLKAEELRRDRDKLSTIIEEIKGLAAPTTLQTFPQDSRLAYQYYGRSLEDPIDNPADPRDDHNVARIIVRYAPDFRPDSEILFELRFDR